MSRAERPAGLRIAARFIPELESLRGWAILLVIAFHYFGILTRGQQSTIADAPFLVKIAAAGNTGVTLFFVLSGFLLVQPFIAALQKGEQVSIRRFYWARLLRIVPLYYTAVLIAWLVSPDMAALKALAFIPVGFQMFPFSVPWWSLCTEMQFYLVLPWIMFALQYKVGRYAMVSAGLGWLCLHVYYFHQPGWLTNIQTLWLQPSIFGRGVAFLIGGFCAWLYGSRHYARFVASPKAVLLSYLLLLWALLELFQWYSVMGQQPALMAMPLYHDLEALLWGGLLLCVPSLTGWVKRVFINPLLNHFGTISYSLYLVHIPIQFYLIYPITAAAQGPVDYMDMKTIAALVASFLLSWLLAVLCYRLIEKPFLKLKAHLPVFTDRFRVNPASA